MHDEAGGFGICNDIYQDDKLITVCYHLGYYFELEQKNKKLYSTLEDISSKSNKQIIKIKGKMSSPSSFAPNSVALVTNRIPEKVYDKIVDNLNIEKLELLIKKGYDINAPLDMQGENEDLFKVYPLTSAVEKNAIPIVRYLIKHGADVNVENDVPIAGSERAVSLAAENMMTKFMLNMKNLLYKLS